MTLSCMYLCKYVFMYISTDLSMYVFLLYIVGLTIFARIKADCLILTENARQELPETKKHQVLQRGMIGAQAQAHCHVGHLDIYFGHRVDIWIDGL